MRGILRLVDGTSIGLELGDTDGVSVVDKVGNDLGKVLGSIDGSTKEEDGINDGLS